MSHGENSRAHALVERPTLARLPPSPKLSSRTKIGRTSERACDRCHAVKEKCRRAYNQDTCERCRRLGYLCQILRPVAKAGRKPRCQRTRTVADHAPSSPCSESISPSPSESSGTESNIIEECVPIQFSRSLSVFVDLEDREISFLTGMTQGRTRVDQFLLGPSFRIIHRETLVRQFFKATTLLQDAFIASSALIACESELEPVPKDRMIGHKRAASAVSALRSLQGFKNSDLSVVLMLAVSAITFALHISGSALAICRHSLDLVKPALESLVELDPDCTAFLNCLVHSETAECLFRCEIPTIRLNVQSPERLVDRFMGVASPLLSYFYDVCKVSCALRDNPTIDWSKSMEDLQAIELVVEQWTPNLPTDFLTRFEQAEVLSTLAQANVYRWSLLLICHRLRHPYGSETAKGTAWSDAILTELERTFQSTKRSIPCVNIAFIVACFELVDPAKRRRALEQTEVYIEFSKQLQLKTKAVLKAFWDIRDGNDQFCWFEIPILLPQ